MTIFSFALDIFRFWIIHQSSNVPVLSILLSIFVPRRATTSLLLMIAISVANDRYFCRIN